MCVLWDNTNITTLSQLPLVIQHNNWRWMKNQGRDPSTTFTTWLAYKRKIYSPTRAPYFGWHRREKSPYLIINIKRAKRSYNSTSKHKSNVDFHTTNWYFSISKTFQFNAQWTAQWFMIDHRTLIGSLSVGWPLTLIEACRPCFWNKKLRPAHSIISLYSNKQENSSTSPKQHKTTWRLTRGF